MRRAVLAFLAAVAAALTAVPASAQDPAVGKVTSLPIPRYVSIRADEANLRVGPGGQYPIRWRLLRAGMPAQIVDEENQWREVVLHDGERGWLYAPLLSGARTVYVTFERAPLVASADLNAGVVAYVEKRVVLRVDACEPHWCKVRKGEIKGWIARHMVWGLSPAETFD